MFYFIACKNLSGNETINKLVKELASFLVIFSSAWYTLFTYAQLPRLFRGTWKLP